MSFGSSYNPDTWELTVTIDEKEYTYVEVSPHHNDEFYKRRRNMGRAMAYLKKMGFKIKGDEDEG